MEFGFGAGKTNILLRFHFKFARSIEIVLLSLSFQIKQITDSISSLTTIAKRTTEKKQFNPIVEVPTTFYDAQVNEFICETTNSERSSEEVASHIGKTIIAIFIFVWMKKKKRNGKIHKTNNSQF